MIHIVNWINIKISFAKLISLEFVKFKFANWILIYLSALKQQLLHKKIEILALAFLLPFLNYERFN